MARQTAEAFLRDEGITSLPVDPFAIAGSRDIMVKAKPDAAEGVSGMLLRYGDTFGIYYATPHPERGFLALQRRARAGPLFFKWPYRSCASEERRARFA